MAKKGTSKKRSAGSSESARRGGSNGSREEGFLSNAAGQLRAFSANVPWKRAATVAACVAVTAIAVRAIGPKRIVRGVSSLGIAHLAEKNAHKLSALAHGLAARWWPRVVEGTASVVKKPIALIGR